MSEPAQEQQQIRIGANIVRCPYCHDDVDPSEREWVACSGCLARHHRECWDEGAACSSCGEPERLERAGVSRAAELQLEGRDPRRARLHALPEDRIENAPNAFLGAPSKLVLERVFEGEATIADAAWLDAAVRRATKLKGKVSLENRQLVWRPHGDNGCRSTALVVTLATKGGKTTVRIEEDLRGALIGTIMGSLGVLCALLSVGLGIFDLSLPLLLLPVLAAALIWADRALYRRHAEKRELALGDLLARLTDGLTWAPPLRMRGGEKNTGKEEA